MNTPFNFKSQVCTDKVQSERLLALGLKKETADCYWFYCDIAKEWKCTILSSTLVFKDYPTTVIPAWSLHRMIVLMPENIEHKMYGTLWRTIYANDVFYTDWKDNTPVARTLDLYEHLIFYIEWLIKEGYFPKEYLV